MSSASACSKFSAARLVLFDAVGTLIYPEPAVADVYFSLAQQFGSRLSKPEISGRFKAALAKTSLDATNDSLERNRWRQIVATILDDVAEIEPLFELLWQHFSEGRHWRLFEDVVAHWPELVQRGVPLGIASNFDRRLDRVLAELPLPGLAYVFSSAQVGFSKPDGRFFTEIERQTGVKPHEILLVGDDPVADGMGASHSGWQSVLIDRNYSMSPHLSGEKPDLAVIHSIGELLPEKQDS